MVPLTLVCFKSPPGTTARIVEQAQSLRGKSLIPVTKSCSRKLLIVKG